MFINVVVYTFPAGRADEAQALLAQLRDASVGEAGCIGFDVSRSIDDPRVFVLYEQWTDRAALDTHFATDHFQKYGANGIRKLAESRTAYATSRIA